jgi:hypothetical protein
MGTDSPVPVTSVNAAETKNASGCARRNGSSEEKMMTKMIGSAEIGIVGKSNLGSPVQIENENGITNATVIVTRNEEGNRSLPDGRLGMGTIMVKALPLRSSSRNGRVGRKGSEV